MSEQKKKKPLTTLYKAIQRRFRFKVIISNDTIKKNETAFWHNAADIATLHRDHTAPWSVHKTISTATASRDLAYAVKNRTVEKSGTKALTKYRFTA